MIIGDYSEFLADNYEIVLHMSSNRFFYQNMYSSLCLCLALHPICEASKGVPSIQGLGDVFPVLKSRLSVYVVTISDVVTEDV